MKKPTSVIYRRADNKLVPTEEVTTDCCSCERPADGTMMVCPSDGYPIHQSCYEFLKKIGDFAEENVNYRKYKREKRERNPS